MTGIRFRRAFFHKKPARGLNLQPVPLQFRPTEKTKLTGRTRIKISPFPLLVLLLVNAATYLKPEGRLQQVMGVLQRTNKLRGPEILAFLLALCKAQTSELMLHPQLHRQRPEQSSA